MITFLAQTLNLVGVVADPAHTGEGVLSVTSICTVIATGIAVIGVAVLVYGVVKSAVAFIRNEATRQGTESRDRLRLDLGYYLLLGLEILVAADVIETLMAPDLHHVLVLGAIVLIRTVISFSLNWELAHERKQATTHTQPEVV